MSILSYIPECSFLSIVRGMENAIYEYVFDLSDNSNVDPIVGSRIVYFLSTDKRPPIQTSCTYLMPSSSVINILPDLCAEHGVTNLGCVDTT